MIYEPTPTEREAHRRHVEFKRKIAERAFELSKPVALETTPEPPEPASKFDEWLARQDRNNPLPKEPWFSVESETPQVVTIEDIKRAVCQHARLTMVELLANRRLPSVVLARQVGMYLAKTETSRSYPDIGARFGFRDHTTVMHGVKKIASLIETDPLIAGHVAAVKALLEAA